MDEVMEYLVGRGYENILVAKPIAGRRYAALLPYSFGRARIIVGSLDNKYGFDQQIEFDSLRGACRALESIEATTESEACT